MMYNLNEYSSIIVAPDAMLKVVSEKYDFDNPQLDLEELSIHAATIFSKYPTAKAFSLIQIGIPVRIYITNKDSRLFMFINPTVASPKGVKDSIESCASVDTTVGWHDYFTIKRPMSCVLNWYDKKGDTHRKLLYYPETRLPYHEIDHMNGKLISDSGKYYIRSKANK